MDESYPKKAVFLAILSPVGFIFTGIPAAIFGGSVLLNKSYSGGDRMKGWIGVVVGIVSIIWTIIATNLALGATNYVLTMGMYTSENNKSTVTTLKSTSPKDERISSLEMEPLKISRQLTADDPYFNVQIQYSIGYPENEDAILQLIVKRKDEISNAVQTIIGTTPIHQLQNIDYINKDLKQTIVEKICEIINKDVSLEINYERFLVLPISS